MDEKQIIQASQEIIWIPTGLAARILGCSTQTVTVKYFGSVRCLKMPSGQRKWCLQDVQALALELRER